MVLESLTNIEAFLPVVEFVAVDGKPCKILESGNQWLKVVKGDRGRTPFGYNRDTQEIVELKSLLALEGGDHADG